MQEDYTMEDDDVVEMGKNAMRRGGETFMQPHTRTKNRRHVNV